MAGSGRTFTVSCAVGPRRTFFLANLFYFVYIKNIVCHRRVPGTRAGRANVLTAKDNICPRDGLPADVLPPMFDIMSAIKLSCERTVDK